MAYIGSTPTTQSFISGTDYFNGTGSQTSFTLSRPVGSVNDIQAVVNNVVQVPNDAYNVSGTSIVFTSAPSAGTGNVYVRYMSTTTQSITPSQNTVSYSTLNTDLQSGGYASNFKNRIINGDMVINQRALGTVTINSSGTYTTDRWVANQTAAGKFSVQNSTTAPAGFTNSYLATSLSSYSVSSSDIFFFQQNIEGFNTADLAWGTASASPVTLSFWVRSSLTGAFGGALANATQDYCYPFSYTISAANTWEQKSITITGATAGTWVTNNGIGVQVIFGLGGGSGRSATAGSWTTSPIYTATGATSVVGTSGATFYITGVQLEKGSTATSFDYRPYGTELALCQRYCVRFLGNQNFEVIPSALNAYSTVGAQGPVTAPVTMRTVPTLSFSTLLFTDVASINNAIGSATLSTSNSGTQAFWIDIQSTSLTVGRTGYIKANNSTSANFILSAEL
jgi:hypothetical protein